MLLVDVLFVISYSSEAGSAEKRAKAMQDLTDALEKTNGDMQRAAKVGLKIWQGAEDCNATSSRIHHDHANASWYDVTGRHAVILRPL